MITTRYIGLGPVSIVDSLTANYVRFSYVSGPPKGLIIPVNAASEMTISFYAKRGLAFYDPIYCVLDTYIATGGSFINTSFNGAIASVPDRYCFDGTSSPYAVVQSMDFDATKFHHHVLRFAGIPFSAGFIYLSMDGNGQHYQDVNFADVRLYERLLSLAEIGKPLMPNDYNSRYTFAGFQPGDLVATDSGPNGNDARFYY